MIVGRKAHQEMIPAMLEWLGRDREPGAGR